MMDEQSTVNGAGNADNMELRLWAYIDGISDEATLVEKLVVESREWKEKYAELLQVHQLAASVELEEPSLRFTKSVMEEIGRLQVAPAAKRYINTRITNGIAAFFVLVITGTIIFLFSQIDWSSPAPGSAIAGIDLSKIDYSHLLNNTVVRGFMLLNVVLGLTILDRYLHLRRGKALEAQHR